MSSNHSNPVDRSLKIMVIYGTRPEAIKMAPLISALCMDPKFQVTAIMTGQHLEMVEEINKLFGIRVRRSLGIFTQGQSITDLVIKILSGVQEVIATYKPDCVVVQGDTTSSLGGSLAAFNASVPVIHLEAGLRTGKSNNPFPEEVNRRIISQIAELHLAPTISAKQNLLACGVTPECIWVTGNTVIDALHSVITAQPPIENTQLGSLLFRENHKIILLTMHRRESWGAPIESVGRAIIRIAKSFPDCTIVFPMHPNPLIRKPVLTQLSEIKNVLLIEPLSYGDFCQALSMADVVLTDSGGVQEEAPSMGVPVLVLRDYTERFEGVDAGVSELVGTDENRIVQSVSELLLNPKLKRIEGANWNPYGDGLAAVRAVAAIAHMFGLGPPPDQYLSPTTI